MGRFEFRGLDEMNWLKVCSCGHVDNYDPRAVKSRRRYLEAEAANGLVLLVAVPAGRQPHDLPQIGEENRGSPGEPRPEDGPLGFVELVPIETAARDVTGEGALFLHCVNVFREGLGVGRALVEEAARLAALDGRGLVVDACQDVYGFMPAGFFSRLGFETVAARGSRRLMARGPGRDGTGSLPKASYLEPSYTFQPSGEAVVVDVFFTPLCDGHWSVELETMREAARRYPGRVVVRGFDAGDPEVRRRWGIARAVFVNGVMRPNSDVIGFGEACRLIEEALQASPPDPGKPGTWDDTISRLF